MVVALWIIPLQSLSIQDNLLEVNSICKFNTPAYIVTNYKITFYVFLKILISTDRLRS